MRMGKLRNSQIVTMVCLKPHHSGFVSMAKHPLVQITRSTLLKRIASKMFLANMNVNESPRFMRDGPSQSGREE